MSTIELICVVQPLTWPTELQEWGKRVAKTTPHVDPFPEPPVGYFDDSPNDRYHLHEAIYAARLIWGN